ncbi:DUF2568 domain-containing protein [Streptomyces katrae]|uniref:DUF2568 domain-containing protein n=1 Tax=Streptomyces katrae TaxID=68223 RepID=UPI0009A515A1|nr:DUF2568 domain-containing protein [Streptomyces katrae]
MLPTPLRAINEGLAFLLELAGLALLAWWGWSTGHNTLTRILQAVGVAFAAVAVVNTALAERDRRHRR